MSCLYLHEILPVSVLTSTFHTSHGLIDSLIRYSVFKVQTANLFDLLKAFDVGLVSRAYFVTGIRPPLPVMDRFVCASTLTVPCHEGHFSLLSWRLRDSNSRPPACKAGALPTELHPHLIWQPPALPHRLQCSTIGRLGLNRRVRDGNGCVP